jgi:tetratricopeptide (TPR) repeat protein
MFAHEFYGALADGYPIDAALTEARKAIFAAGREVEWGTPVLYLRAPDGRIFDVAPRAQPAAAGESLSPPETPPRSDRQPRSEPQPEIASEPETAQARALAFIRGASVLLAQGEYEEAFEHLRNARALDPDVANLSELTEIAQEQRAVAATRARRREAFREQLAAAATSLARGDPGAASEHVEEALRLKQDDPAALDLQARIRTALNEAAARPRAPEKPGSRRIPPDDESDLLDR